MRQVELIYTYQDQKESDNMQGRVYRKGIGKCQIEANNDPERTVSVTMISNLIEPRNSRLIATLQPGQSFQLVRPTATLVIRNTASEK